MAEETWRSWGLSSHVQSASKAVADLQSSLMPHMLTDETVEALEVLKSELLELRTAVGLQGPSNASVSANPSSSPVVKKLAESAVATLWDAIPLHAIADEHKRRADRFQDDGDRTAEVYVGYQKYLQLFAGPKDGPEFGCQSPPPPPVTDSDGKKSVQPGLKAEKEKGWWARRGNGMHGLAAK
ncbi:hypothetical protein B0H14DRAFT_2571006 [Mycena olivaceomarginata]|nr:hypothetical protein B0H14DRAFT_2571006 [Mycena olivaceomarginata]